MHEHDHGRFLDMLKGRLGGDWRIHLLLADDEAVQLVPTLTALEFGPGDPINLNPEKFVNNDFGISKTRTDALADIIATR